MNFKYDLCVNPSLLKDSTTAVLSTILFHRSLGSTVPSTREIFTNVSLALEQPSSVSSSGSGTKTQSNPAFSNYKKSQTLSYPCITDPDTDSLIDHKISELVYRFRESSSSPFNNVESSQIQGNLRQNSKLLYTLSVMFISANQADEINLSGKWVQNEQGEDVWCWEEWNIQCFGKFLFIYFYSFDFYNWTSDR